MKTPSLIPILFATAMMTFLGTTGVLAQATEGPGAQLSFLSDDDRAHLLKVRQQVLESNADLKTEQESLEKEGKYVKDKGTGATPEDRKTLMNNLIAHSKKMHEAMLQADPTISPVLDQIQAKMKERLSQRSGRAGGDGNNGA